MNILHGLMPGQVLQRDAQGRGAAQIDVACAVDGALELRVLKAGKVLRGHAWAVVGQVGTDLRDVPAVSAPADTAARRAVCASEMRTYSVSLTDLPTGGPYRVELRVKQGRKVVDRLAVDEVFVGDVWILAGQSNMEGLGNLIHAPKPQHQVRAFFMRDEWGMAEEKLHYLCEAVDKVHNSYGDEPGRPPKAELEKGRANLIKGTSPGLAFALDMYRRTRVPQGVIPCAHGGTSMAQWSPALRDQGGASLYGAMMRRYVKLVQPVAGVVWYQGESDANRDAAAIYTEKMVELVAATRADMALPRLPWLIVQLGCHAATEDGWSWNSIQEQQRLLPGVIQHLDVAPAIDLELDDGIHIGGKSQVVLGRRLARLADRLVHKAAGVKPGIVLKKMAVVPTPHRNIGAACTSVEITYGHVAGGLVSDGRPNGFALLDAKGQDIRGIYKTTVKGSGVLLHTNMSRYELEMLSVSYGHGRQSYCNITDREGMSIPAMQAIPIEPEHMHESTGWETALLSSVTSIARTSYARAANATRWFKAPPREVFGVLPKPANADQVGVYAMRTTLTATESLEASLLFGANAPFKIWLNGQSVMSDRACTIPLTPDQYQVSLRLRRGDNRMLVAFAPPGPGAHLGLFACVGTADLHADPRVSWKID